MWLRDSLAVPPYVCSREVLQYKVGLKFMIMLDSRLSHMFFPEKLSII